MCEVTKENFNEIIPVIEHSLKKCSFVSLDCEFSSLPTDWDVDHSFFDSGQDRYAKIYPKVYRSKPLQVGLSIFKYHRDLNKFDAKIFTFHIFPKHFGDYNSDYHFKSSTIEFLLKFGFNFNKCFSEGITYLNDPKKKKLLSAFENNSFLYEVGSGLSLDDHKQILTTVSSVQDWRAESGEVKDKDSLLIPLDLENILLLYVIKEELKNTFRDIWVESDPKNSGIQVTRVSEEQRSLLEKESDSKEKDDLINHLVGFSRVMKLIAASNKPVVGHNFYYDLLVMYNEFFEELPGSYKKFKKNICSVFPSIYDTKYLYYELQRSMRKEVFDTHSLSSLYEDYTKKVHAFGPTIKPEEGLYQNEDGQHAHNAGWDSFMTGYCFIKIASSFVSLENPAMVKPITFIEQHHIISRFKNRVNIARARVSYVDFEGNDPPSRRPPYLCLTDTSGSSLSHLEVYYSLYRLGAYQMKKLTPCSSIVAVPNYSVYKTLLRKFDGHPKYKLEKYMWYKHKPVRMFLVWIVCTIPAGIVFASIWSLLERPSITTSKS